MDISEKDCDICICVDQEGKPHVLLVITDDILKICEINSIELNTYDVLPGMYMAIYKNGIWVLTQPIAKILDANGTENKRFKIKFYWECNK